MEGRAARLDDPPDGGAAAAAGFPRRLVAEELRAVLALFSIGVPVGRERGSHTPDAGLEDVGNLRGDPVPLRGRERAGLPARIDLRAEQHLADIDVAEPGDPALVEEPRLDRRAGAVRGGAERRSALRLGEGVRTEEPERSVLAERIRGDDPQHAEAADVL